MALAVSRAMRATMFVGQKHCPIGKCGPKIMVQPGCFQVWSPCGATRPLQTCSEVLTPISLRTYSTEQRNKNRTKTWTHIQTQKHMGHWKSLGAGDGLEQLWSCLIHVPPFSFIACSFLQVHMVSAIWLHVAAVCCILFRFRALLLLYIPSFWWIMLCFKILSILSRACCF